MDRLTRIYKTTWFPWLVAPPGPDRRSHLHLGPLHHPVLDQLYPGLWIIRRPDPAGRANRIPLLNRIAAGPGSSLIRASPQAEPAVPLRSWRFGSPAAGDGNAEKPIVLHTPSDSLRV